MGDLIAIAACGGTLGLIAAILIVFLLDFVEGELCFDMMRPGLLSGCGTP